MSGPVPPVPFATVRPGLRIPPLRVEVRDSTNRRLCDAVGAEPAADGRVTIPLAGNLNIGAAFVVLPLNILHTRQRIAVEGKARVGDGLTVEASVTGARARRGKAYASVGASISCGGKPVWRTEAEFTVPAMAAGSLPEGAREPLEVPEGARVVGSRTHRFTLADMASFSGRGNFHSDRAIASSYGYAAPLAQGMHVAAVGFALLDEVRSGWDRPADVDLRFVGETPEGCSVVVDALAGDEGEMWLRGTRDDGVAVLAGRAQVPARL